MFATSLSRQNFQDTIETHIWYKHEGKVRLLLFLISFPCTNFHLNRINCLYFLCFRNFKTRGFLLLFFPSEEFSFSLNNYATIFTYLFVLVIISRIVEFRIGKDENKLMWFNIETVFENTSKQKKYRFKWKFNQYSQTNISTQFLIELNGRLILKPINHE